MVMLTGIAAWANVQWNPEQGTVTINKKGPVVFRWTALSNSKRRKMQMDTLPVIKSGGQ